VTVIYDEQIKQKKMEQRQKDIRIYVRSVPVSERAKCWIVKSAF